MKCITCAVLEQEPVSDVSTIRVGKYEVGVCEEHKPLYEPLPDYTITVTKGEPNVVEVKGG